MISLNCFRNICVFIYMFFARWGSYVAFFIISKEQKSEAIRQADPLLCVQLSNQTSLSDEEK